MLSCFKYVIDNYVFNIFACTLLAPSSKICRLSLKNNLSAKIACFVDQRVFQNVYDFFLHITQS